MERASVETGVTVKLGLDVHAAQITVCRQNDGQVPQPPRPCRLAEVLAQVRALRQAGATVYSCYEAGPCGYGLHRALTALGVTNWVVVPQCWDERGRRVKTDRRDARELCLRLDRYVRGNRAAFAVVRVPTEAQEQARALCRQRAAVLKERQRSLLRGHSLMLLQGRQAPPGWWAPRRWAELAPQLPAWLRAQVAWWQGQAVHLDQEVTALTAQVEALNAGQPTPYGLGALSAAILQAEILDWGRFHNRRQVGSYTGLCPSEYSTGQRRRQGAVTKHGNPRLRQVLVEAIWRLLVWQPDYPPLQRVRQAVGRRARKRAVTAAARRLAIDLWRIRTHQCMPEPLGLKLA